MNKLGIFLALVMILGSTPLGFAQELEYIRTISLDDYKLYDFNNQEKFLIDSYTMSIFESQFIEPFSDTFNEQTIQTAAIFGQDLVIIDWDSKISAHTQRDVYFVNLYLGQTMTNEELEETYYDFTLTFDGKADHLQFPDYVKVLTTSETFREDVSKFPDEVGAHLKAVIPDDEQVRILAPITKMNELLEIDKVKKIADDRNQILGKLSLASRVLPQQIPFELEYNFEKYLSPKEQLKNGLSSFQIQCNNELEIAMKHDNSPVCVSIDSLDKLEQRNWLSRIASQ